MKGTARSRNSQSRYSRKRVEQQGKETTTPAENQHDGLGQPWLDPQRPPGSCPPKDNGFCIEDEGTSALVENLLSSLTVTDPHQRGNPLVFVSPAFEAMTGYASEDLIGANCRVLQGKTPDKEKTVIMQQAMQKRQFVSIELTNYRKDGKSFQNLLCIAPVLDAYDNLVRYIGIQCDLNEKKRKESNEEFDVQGWAEQIKQHTSSFMLVDSSAGHVPINAISPAFSQLTGYLQSDLLGCSCVCLSGPDTSTTMLKKWVHAQWHGKPIAVKLLLYKKDGAPFWAYVFSCPLTPPKTAPAAQQTLCVVMDVTATRLKRVGRYQLGKVLGSGAYGIVRLGRQQDEIVAVKAVDASKFRSISEIEQIQEEMSVLSSLSHPHIIRLIEIHFISNTFFLVMEFAAGGSLVKHTHKHPGNKLPELEAKRLFVQMVSALDYCHRRRVIHRDLKPENILMDERNNIKIADFGLATITAPSSKGLSQQCGTPEFTAPEITSGKEYSGPCVDIWSLGVMLYEVLAGELPFNGVGAALAKSIQRGVYVPLPSHISVECQQLVKGMLRTDPKARLTMDQILVHPWLRSHEAADMLLSPRGENGLLLRCSSPGGLHALELVSPKSRHSMGRNSSYMHSHTGSDIEHTDDEHDDGLSRQPSRADKLNRTLSRELHGGSSLQGGRSSHQSLGNSTSKFSSSNPLAHDSVRITVNVDDADTNDPISAAIMRAQLATMGLIHPEDVVGTPAKAMGSFSHSAGAHEHADVCTPSRQTVSASKGNRDLTPSRTSRAGEGSFSSGGATSRMALPNSRHKAANGSTAAGALPPLQQLKPDSPTSDRRHASSEIDSGAQAVNHESEGLIGARRNHLLSYSPGTRSGARLQAGAEGLGNRQLLPPIQKSGSGTALHKLLHH